MTDKKWQKEYYLKNKERIKEYQKKRYSRLKNNPEYKVFRAKQSFESYYRTRNRDIPDFNKRGNGCRITYFCFNEKNEKVLEGNRNEIMAALNINQKQFYWYLCSGNQIKGLFIDRW